MDENEETIYTKFADYPKWLVDFTVEYSQKYSCGKLLPTLLHFGAVVIRAAIKYERSLVADPKVPYILTENDVKLLRAIGIAPHET